MLANLRIGEFLERTASSAPVPGGGSIAALSAAASASLLEMVANLTVGKDGFETVEGEMKEIAREARSCRVKLIQNIDRDASAFTGCCPNWTGKNCIPRRADLRFTLCI